jgi:hypothetical protein
MLDALAVPMQHHQPARRPIRERFLRNLRGRKLEIVISSAVAFHPAKTNSPEPEQ